MSGEPRFEAQQGWVAVSADGSTWCYRGRGNAGVLVFEHTMAGPTLYQATHQDCFSTDTTLTTESWQAAVRFAAEGVAEPSVQAAPPQTPEPIPQQAPAREDTTLHATAGHAEQPAPPGAAPATPEHKAALLQALLALSPTERRELLDRLREAGVSEESADGRGRGVG